MGDEFDRNRRYVDSMTEKQVQEWLEGDTKHRTGKHESKMSRELNPVVRRTHDKVVSSMNQVKKATESVLKMQLEIEKAGKELAWMKRRTGRMQTGSPTKDDPDPSKYPEVYHQREELDKGDWSENESGRGRLKNPRTDAKPDEEIRERGRVTIYNKPGASHHVTVEKGDEMDEIEKEMKGPESPGVKKPGKIPLSANKQAITEEPADRSSTSQNYKNTPDMNKAITKSDEAELKKCITDATTIFKGMTLMLDKGTLKENRAGRGDMRGMGEFTGGHFPNKADYAEAKENKLPSYGNIRRETLRSHGRKTK